MGCRRHTWHRRICGRNDVCVVAGAVVLGLVDDKVIEADCKSVVI